MNCEFCKNVFRNISSLNNHQKTAKYCLDIQGKKSLNTFECENCNSTFTLKSTLDKHLNRFVYNREKIKELKFKILLLQAENLSIKEKYNNLLDTMTELNNNCIKIYNKQITSK